MLAEINEKDATGDTARIFEEIRHLWGVPYVSAIHRHLATRPGVLEWAWEAVAPVFRDGRAQEAGWSCAANVALSPLDPIPPDVLAVWGLDAAALKSVQDIAEGFVRVAPVNMMFAGLVKSLLDGGRPGGQTFDSARTWLPPAALRTPPAMIDPDVLGMAQRAVLMRFATPSAGTPFVPGLYRMLAHWPSLLAHLAVVLGPRLAAAQTVSACDQLRARIDAAVPDVLAALGPPPSGRAVPNAGERAHFLSIGGTYRRTSPELVVVGRLIRDAIHAD
jgi:hypothetical protein